MEALNAIKNLHARSIDLMRETVARTTNGITRQLEKLDRWLCRNDRIHNYTYGAAAPWRLKADGHFFMISWVLLMLAAFVVLGPNLDALKGGGAILLAVALVVGALLPLRVGRPAMLYWLQLVFVLLVSLLVWLVFSDGHIQRDGMVYRHALIPALWIILVGTLFAYWLAGRLFRIYRGRFAEHIKNVELFYLTENFPMVVTYKAFLRSVATTPFYHLLKLVFFPAVMILIIADRDVMYFFAAGMLVVSFFYLAAASVHERLNYLLELLNGLLFKGGHLVLSYVVVGLALGRLFKQSHITTLIESSPGNVNWTIVFYVFSLYVLFWLYEYWINRFLLERFVAIFADDDNNATPGKIKFEAHVSGGTIAKKDRVLQAHGGSRLILLGKEEQGGRERWNLFSRGGLLDSMFGKLDARKADIYRDSQEAGVIKQRMRFYFLMLNLYLVIAFFWLGWHYYQLPQKAEVAALGSIPQQQRDQLFDLRRAIFDVKNKPAQQPRIFIAASGGGTRAAIYSESVLRGLNEHGMLGNVVLTSSVSGGSAAMAYLGLYRNELVGAGEDEWDQFSDVMAAPFILDVLEGIVDWRMVAGMPQAFTDPGNKQTRSYDAGLRMGELLAESFQHRFGLVGSERGELNRLGSQRDFGMIFNTTVVAKFPRWQCKLVQSNESWKRCLCNDQQGNSKPIAVSESQCPQLRTSLGQGGRLVFTNLQELQGFPSSGEPVADDFLTYIRLQDPEVKLTHAAALSANFPPVFPNAAVDIDNRQRYWVTDGGAADNRGVLSLLYALKHAVLQEVRERCPEGQCVKRSLPAIQVIIADASATSLKFSGNSGVPAALSAPTRFASQLIVEQAQQIQRMYELLGGKAQFHYLPMPLILRSQGGLGTHWMMPTEVNFNQPLDIRRKFPNADRSEIALSGDDTRMLIDALHSSRRHLPVNEKTTRLWQWICGEEYGDHQRRWKNAITAIKPEARVTDRCAGLTSHESK